MVIIINKIFKQIIKIADKEKIELISLNPIYQEMPEMETFLILFKSMSDDDSLELDIVYITFTENGDNILFPINNDKILEDLIVKITPSKLKEMLLKYKEIEENEEIEIFN